MSNCKNWEEIQLLQEAWFINIRFQGGWHATILYVFACLFSWNKTENPEPWNKLDPTYQYKVMHHTYVAVVVCIISFQHPVSIKFDLFPLLKQFVAITTDYKNLKKEGPDYWIPQPRVKWNPRRSWSRLRFTLFSPLTSTMQNEGEMDPKSGCVQNLLVSLSLCEFAKLLVTCLMWLTLSHMCTENLAFLHTYSREKRHICVNVHLKPQWYLSCLSEHQKIPYTSQIIYVIDNHYINNAALV